MTRGLALLGHNISYTLSPLIHNTACRYAGAEYVYLPVDISPGKLSNALDALRLLGFAGGNVTIPHKIEIMKFIDSISETARRIGAVNTFTIADGSLTGHNTDADGFFYGYEGELSELHGEPVLILGTGGAARAVLDALAIRTRPALLLIAGRSEGRIEALMNQANSYGIKEVEAVPWNKDGLYRAAIRAKGIIQTTPIGSSSYIGMSPVEVSFPFSENHIVIDLIYDPTETSFLSAARKRGSRASNGLPMLLNQAALAFTIWTGLSFPLTEVQNTVQQHIQQHMTMDL